MMINDKTVDEGNINMIFSDIPFKLGHALFTTESLPEQK